MKSKQPPLIPPDKKQCQAERKDGCRPDAEHFMIMGPAVLIRCRKKPTVIATETEPGEDGRRGSMSLCDEHAAALVEQHGATFATFKKIK